uniref:Uncharacterized protein n=1 Tax=Manihot esculenta TaxID=3983 RepID=A0A2C9UA09_MANES
MPQLKIHCLFLIAKYGYYRYSLFIKVKIHSKPTYLVGCAISS